MKVIQQVNILNVKRGAQVDICLMAKLYEFFEYQFNSEIDQSASDFWAPLQVFFTEITAV